MFDEIDALLVQCYGSGKILFFLYLAALAYLLVFRKERRKTLVFPSLLLMAALLNPLSYRVVSQKIYWYWRLLWILPMAPVIGCAAVDFLFGGTPRGRRRKRIAAGILLFAAALIFPLGAACVYAGNTFVKAENSEKVPDGVIEVSDYLLSVSDAPRVVMSSRLYCYIRQYTSKIEMMYGRDADGYITSGYMEENAKEVSEQMRQEVPNMEFVTDCAREGGYTFIVADAYLQIDEEEMQEYGFPLIAEIKGYRIYQDAEES